MARSRSRDRINPRLVQIIHAISRTTRACWLFGDDPRTGKNYDHRKQWIEDKIRHFAAHFAIDVLSFSILSNHHHQMLRSRPDIVEGWDDTEVARRWLMICPARKNENGLPIPPTQSEIDQIRNNAEDVAEKRVRLSDVSWWMRLLNQDIAQRSNKEEDARGKFFEERFKGIPLVDEEAVLACAVYVDLNWIRACMAKTIELSDHTSAQRRYQSQKSIAESSPFTQERRARLADSFLAPVDLCESIGLPGPQPSSLSERCSDKGFLPLSAPQYLELLDWSARQIANGKSGYTPEDLPPILERLGLLPTVWLTLVANFDSLFSTIAGRPEHIDQERGHETGRRFHVRQETRELFAQSA